jgi:hypothetical protein
MSSPTMRPDRQSRAPLRAVKRPKLLLENSPIHRAGKPTKRMPRIDLAFKVGEQKRDLGSVGNGGFHGRGLQGFRVKKQVLPAI